MLQRIAGLVITAAGIVLALLVGFWALIFLGVVALIAAAVYFVRTRTWRAPRKREREIIEGEFVVLDENHKEGDTHRDG